MVITVDEFKKLLALETPKTEEAVTLDALQSELKEANWECDRLRGLVEMWEKKNKKDTEYIGTLEEEKRELFRSGGFSAARKIGSAIIDLKPFRIEYDSTVQEWRLFHRENQYTIGPSLMSLLENALADKGKGS